MADSVGWRVRGGSSVARFSDRLVVRGRTPGMLDLSVCLLAAAHGSPGRLGLLGPLAAACTSEGIRRDTGIISWLQWPDLVTVDGRVVAKASVSAAAAGPGAPARIVLRASVDCFSRRPTPFPRALPSTSILDVLGVEIDVDLLGDKVLHAVDWYFAEWERGMYRKLVERMEPTISWLGHEVEVKTSDSNVISGRAKGLDMMGSLLLERRGGIRAIPPEQVELVCVAD